MVFAAGGELRRETLAFSEDFCTEPFGGNDDRWVFSGVILATGDEPRGEVSTLDTVSFLFPSRTDFCLIGRTSFFQISTHCCAVCCGCYHLLSNHSKLIGGELNVLTAADHAFQASDSFSGSIFSIASQSFRSILISSALTGF